MVIFLVTAVAVFTWQAVRKAVTDVSETEKQTESEQPCRRAVPTAAASRELLEYQGRGLCGVTEYMGLRFLKASMKSGADLQAN